MTSLSASFYRIEGPMAPIRQDYSTSSRSAAMTTRENRGIVALDPRPYLVTNQKTVPSNQRYLALFPYESEDAKITGSTRSLNRRLLALNLPNAAISAPVVPLTPVETPSPIVVTSVKSINKASVSSRIA